MTSAPRILVVGYNAWDDLLEVDVLPERDSKCEVPPILSCGGGPGATAAVALARLGAEVNLLTVFGDDLASLAQRAELTAAGVDFAGSPTVRHGRSPRAVIMVHPRDGARTIFWSRGNLRRLEPSDLPAPDAFPWDMLYIDGHEPEAALALAALAQRAGRPVVMDAGSVREGSAELVAAATDVVSSAVFAPALTGLGDPGEALAALRGRGPERVGLTAGEGGVLGLDGAGFCHVPAYDVEVRDTTGAGDAFHAGYAFARARGESFRAALDWGSAVAALKCTGRGGRSTLPDPQEVLRLQTTGNRLPVPPAFAHLLG